MRQLHRAVAFLALLLVAQLGMLRGVMACANPEATHAAHGAPRHRPAHHDAGHLPGAGCPAAAVCALVALPSVAADRELPVLARAERIAGPASPRAWAPRAPEPPPPRG